MFGEMLIGIDERVTLAINQLHFPLTDQLWMFMSNKYVWIPLYVLLVLSMWKNIGWKKTLVFAVMTTLAFVTCENIANLFKDSVQRLRPCYNEFMLNGSLNLLEGRGGLYGFFSAHAANAAAIAVVSIFAFSRDKDRSHRGFNAIIISWAVLLAISRVFVGKHFLGDVLTGMMIGTLVGLIFGAAGNKISARIDRQKDRPHSAARADNNLLAGSTVQR